MSRSHELAWAAGFIDGDGFITIGTRNQTINGKTYTGHYLRVGCNHVGKAPIDELYRLFGGNVKYNPKVKGNRKARYQWTLNTSAAKECLVQLLPYLVNKREVSLLGIELQNTMGTTSRVKDDILKRRDEIKKEVMRLNALD